MVLPLRLKVYELEASLKSEKKKNAVLSLQFEALKKKHKKLYSNLNMIRELDLEDILDQ